MTSRRRARQDAPAYEFRCQDSQEGRQRCGFRVPEDYWEEHPNFYPGMCPTCGSAVVVVFAHTNDLAPGLVLDFESRRLVEARQLPAPAYYTREDDA